MDMFSSYTAGFDQTSLAIEKQKMLLENIKNNKEAAKAKDAAEDFEAFFLTKTMETMFDGISTDGMFGGGHAEKIYRSLLLNEYGKAMSKTGSVGVADYVMNTIIEMQEQATIQAAPESKEV